MFETDLQRPKSQNGDARPKLLAFYLPQFHPTPENDLWWGKGYTEWANVANAKPLFPGHYQPHLPADLGFYDLRLPEARKAQADLARSHGIYGFCYYHYWFKGRRLLERPFQEVLDTGEPDFPFCLAWANHTWTWKRDHNLQGRLMEQEYSEEDDRKHIRWLLRAFQDRRYIRVEGRPMLLIYWTTSLPDPAKTFAIWREECEKAGEERPYVVKMDSFGNFEAPGNYSCDAASEFWPHSVERMATRIKEDHIAFEENRVFDYREFALAQLERLHAQDTSFTRFPCVVPSWDNTARWKSTGALMLHNSTPEFYRAWLSEVTKWTVANLEPDKRFIFVNAWNEWGEGTHLEPDLKHGRAYLEATRDALAENGFAVSRSTPDDGTATPASPEVRYERLLAKYQALQEQLTRYQDEEEYSPLLLRAETRYAELERKYNRLAQELRVARGYNQNLHQRLEKLDPDKKLGSSGSLRAGTLPSTLQDYYGPKPPLKGTGLLASLKQRNERLATPLIRAVESVRLGGPRVVVERLRRLFR